MVTIALQAGGMSRRMGRDKARVLLDGRPLITHVLERAAPLGDEVLVTTNEPQAYAFLGGVRLVPDEQPGAGALAGLRTALRAASHERLLVLACDLPFVSIPLIEHLLRASPPAEVVIPRWHGELEPLQAVYRRACLAAVERALEEGRRRMIDFHADVRVHVVEEDVIARLDPQGLSFFNINTPADLHAAERQLAETRRNHAA